MEGGAVLGVAVKFDRLFGFIVNGDAADAPYLLFQTRKEYLPIENRAVCGNGEKMS
jgi:hypothetical protein